MDKKIKEKKYNKPVNKSQKKRTESVHMQKNVVVVTIRAWNIKSNWKQKK